LESKGKYVWDPDKQAWVRAGQATESARADAVQPPVREAKKRKRAEADAGAARESSPVEAVVEPEALEEVEEEAVEGWGLENVGAVSRGIALVIDIVLAAIISVITPYILGEGTTASLAVSHSIMFVYFAGMWAWRGQTIGKRLMGIKIVNTDGSPMGVPRSVVRALILFAYYVPFAILGNFLIGLSGTYVFPLLMIVINLVVIAVSKTSRAPHDMIVGTRVVSAASVEEIEEEYEDEAGD
jgi:uncharacterized RDD family membrane protein YckC